MNSFRKPPSPELEALSAGHLAITGRSPPAKLRAPLQLQGAGLIWKYVTVLMKSCIQVARAGDRRRHLSFLVAFQKFSSIHAFISKVTTVKARCRPSGEGMG